MSLLNQENVIGQDRLKNHNIKKYEFKTITSEMIETNKGAAHITETPIVEHTQEEAQNMENTESNAQKIATLEQELVEKLLQKTDELSSSLAKLQIQFEKLQVESEQRVASARDEGYKDGFREAQEKAKEDMFAEIDAQKKALVDSIITLENALKSSQKHLEELEKELSAISVDIAREVIIKIKVNPNDYIYLKEHLEDNTKVEVISDNAVSLGGVVIVSDNGNIDGTIMSRYKNLKQSVLENMRD